MTQEEYARSTFDIGHAIDVRCHELRMTPRHLSEILGVCETTVYKWGIGEIRPGYGKLEIIAKALECSVDELFEIHSYARKPKPAPEKKAAPGVEKCLRCEWGRIEEGVIFCPLVGCAKPDKK